jgi:hypothetical protein
VIYFWVTHASSIYMLVAYAKNVRTDLTATQVSLLNVLVKELE